MVIGIVYCITNVINGKQYVGVTTKTAARRFKEHSKADSYIGKAIRKNGIENFTVSTIDSAATKEELFAKEISWIEKLKTFGEGYNLTLGGEGIKILTKLEITLTSKQQKYIDFINSENKKPVDVNDTIQMVRMIIMNVTYCYLMADYKDVKKQSAKMILKLRDDFREMVLNLNLFNLKELMEWAQK